MCSPTSSACGSASATASRSRRMTSWLRSCFALAAGHVRDVDAPAVEPAVGPEPLADDALRVVEDAAAQLGAGPVELGQGLDPQPRHVARATEPEVEVALGRRRARLGGAEPLVGDAGVVGREVAHDLQAAGVRGVGQPAQRGVAAEDRVDGRERRGVVPVVALAGEDGGEVDDVGAQLLDVVEVLGDAVEVAAVELVADLVALGLAREDGVAPGGRDRPVRHRRPPYGAPRAGEAVGEDLVDDRLARPRRRRDVVADEPEVAGVGDVSPVHPGRVEPGVAGRPTREDEAVRRRGVVHDDPPAPPGLALVAAPAVDPQRDEVRLGVVDDAGVHPVQRGLAGDAHPHRDGVAEAGGRVGDVELRAVVVREVETGRPPGRVRHRRAPVDVVAVVRRRSR